MSDEFLEMLFNPPRDGSAMQALECGDCGKTYLVDDLMSYVEWTCQACVRKMVDEDVEDERSSD